MANVNLKYVSGTTAEEFLFQTTMFAKTRSANFHSYSWNPDAFAFDYGESVMRFGKDALTYTAEIYVYGSSDQKRRWLDNFHMACDQDIAAKTPGRLYWGDMYIGCYVIQTSYGPLDIGGPVDNTVGIYCPYPSWIYEATYLPGAIPKADGMAILSALDWWAGDGEFLTDDYQAPFSALPSDFRVVLLGSATQAAASVTITTKSIETPSIVSDVTTEISFPSVYLGADECIVVDSRHGIKTATKYDISNLAIDLSSAENIYSLRAAESRPFKRLWFNSGPYLAHRYFTVEDCYGPTGYANHTILTIYFERSEPTWISS